MIISYNFDIKAESSHEVFYNYVYFLPAHGLILHAQK